MEVLTIIRLHPLNSLIYSFTHFFHSYNEIPMYVLSGRHRSYVQGYRHINR